MFFNGKRTEEYNEMVAKYESTLKSQTERISELKAEIEKKDAELAAYKQTEAQIKDAIVNATDKAKQIEENAKEIYSLEIDRIKMLYQKWEQLYKIAYDESQKQKVSESVDSFAAQASAAISDTFKKEFNVDFSRQVNTVSEDKPKVVEKIKPQNIVHKKNVEPEFNIVSDDDEKINVRILLQKMLQQANSKAPRIAQVSVNGSNSNNANSRQETIVRRPNFETVKKESEIAAVVSKKADVSVTNDSGFDLKEALNPKGDLETIMEGFDFFDEIDKKDNK